MCGIAGVMGNAYLSARLIQTIEHISCPHCQAAGVALAAGGRIVQFAGTLLADVDDAHATAQAFGFAGIAYAYPAPAPIRERNAQLFVAFTGAITNLRPLRRRLIASGRAKDGASAPELLSDLIRLYLDRDYTPENAFSAALGHLEGVFSLLCLFASDDAPTLIGAHRGLPLWTHHRDGFLTLSCNAPRNVSSGLTQLELGDVAIVETDKFTLIDAHGMRIERSLCAHDGAGRHRVQSELHAEANF